MCALASRRRHKRPIFPCPVLAPNMALFLPFILHSLFSDNAASASYIPFGYQSGDEVSKDRGSYAGSLRYDSRTGIFYIAGATYSHSFDGAANLDDVSVNTDQAMLRRSDCFVAALAAPGRGGRSGDAENPKLLFSRRFGTSAEVPEACSSIALPTSVADDGNSDSSHLVALGHSKDGGLMTDLRDPGTDKAEMYGLVLDLNLSYNDSPAGGEDEVPTGANLIGGRLFHESLVQYPVAMALPPPKASHSGDGNAKAEVYIAMQTNDEDMSNDSFGFGKSEKESETSEDPIAAKGGKSITVKKVGWVSEHEDDLADFFSENRSIRNKQTIVDLWTQEYASPDGTTVLASSLLYVPYISQGGTRDDFLLLAGSTRGFGKAFGMAQPDGTYDSDGFVTKLDPKTGQQKDASGGGVTSMRIRTQLTKDEVIHSICIDEDETDVREAFVVGTTTGVIPGPNVNVAPKSVVQVGSSAREIFVIRLDLDTFKMTWRRQYRTNEGQDVYASGCAVGGGGVYVGGVVEASGVLGGEGIPEDAGLESAGGDDIFVMRFSTAEGDLDFAKQMGTDQDDSLAADGGVAIDENGDAILFGTTKGSLMRAKGNEGGKGPNRRVQNDSRSADVFIMSVSKTGDALKSISALAGGKYYDLSLAPSECVVPNSMLYLVLFAIFVLGPCVCLLVFALRRRQAESRMLRRYVDEGQPAIGTIHKRSKNTSCIAPRFVWVGYPSPSEPGLDVIKRLRVSKESYAGMRKGDMVNLIVLPGHDKSGILLRELQGDLWRTWRNIALVSVPCIVGLGSCALFAHCLSWYGWLIAALISVSMGVFTWCLSKGTYAKLEEIHVFGNQSVEEKGTADGIVEVM